MTGRTLMGALLLVLGTGDLMYLDFVAAPAAFSEAAVAEPDIDPPTDGPIAALDPNLGDPVVPDPNVGGPVVEPIIEDPVIADPNVVDPAIEEPLVEEPLVEEPLVEEPIVAVPVVEEPVVAVPVVEEPVVVVPVVEEPVVAVATPPAVIRPVTLGFGRGGDRVSASNRRRLRQLATQLRAQPGQILSVVGHADSIGAEDFNQRLSLRRARNVGRILGQFGVPSRQIRVEGRGETQPLEAGTSADALARNRRVELRVQGE